MMDKVQEPNNPTDIKASRKETCHGRQQAPANLPQVFHHSFHWLHHYWFPVHCHPPLVSPPGSPLS